MARKSIKKVTEILEIKWVGKGRKVSIRIGIRLSDDGNVKMFKRL